MEADIEGKASEGKSSSYRVWKLVSLMWQSLFLIYPWNLRGEKTEVHRKEEKHFTNVLVSCLNFPGETFSQRGNCPPLKSNLSEQVGLFWLYIKIWQGLLTGVWMTQRHLPRHGWWQKLPLWSSLCSTGWPVEHLLSLATATLLSPWRGPLWFF